MLFKQCRIDISFVNHDRCPSTYSNCIYSKLFFVFIDQHLYLQRLISTKESFNIPVRLFLWVSMVEPFVDIVLLFFFSNVNRPLRTVLILNHHVPPDGPSGDIPAVCPKTRSKLYKTSKKAREVTLFISPEIRDNLSVKSCF